MADENNGGGADWIQAWLEQQREQLRRAASPGAQTTDKTGPDPVKDPLNAWQHAWASAASVGEGASRQFADLISRMPILGLAREQTETWRELMAAQAEYQQLEQELRAVWIKVQSDALNMVETKIRERRQNQGAAATIANYRELYDLWVECGEKVFAEVAHSEAYAKLQAQVGNAVIRLRGGQQAVIERGLKYFDLPTRSELNTVHKQMRELRERVATLEAQLSEARERGQ